MSSMPTYYYPAMSKFETLHNIGPLCKGRNIAITDITHPLFKNLFSKPRNNSAYHTPETVQTATHLVLSSFPTQSTRSPAPGPTLELRTMSLLRAAQTSIS
jgi:hypothetical protein